jgi:hypothetical protein
VSRTLPWTRGPVEGDAPTGPAATAGLAYRAGRFVRITLRPREWGARRITVVLLLVVAGVFTVALARGWALANQIPAWWTSAGVMDESSAAARAEGVEKGVTAALYSHRPDAQEWTVELRSEDANAWMRERLHRWLTNRGERWPQGISPPRVLLEDGRITIGISLRPDSDARERVVSVSFRPELDAGGALLASDASVSVGRALLPGVGSAGGAWATWLPEDWKRGQSGEWLAAVLTKQRPLLDATSIVLEDGRAVSLRALAIEQGRLRITCVSRSGVESGSQ